MMIPFRAASSQNICPHNHVNTLASMINRTNQQINAEKSYIDIFAAYLITFGLKATSNALFVEGCGTMARASGTTVSKP